MFREAVYLPECLDEFINIPKFWMWKNPSIAVFSIRRYIYNCKFITSICQCQQKNCFYLKNLEPLFGGARTFTYFPSMAPVQLRKFHRSQKSFTISDQVVRVGVGLTSCFKCFVIDLHTSWTALCTVECPRRKPNEIVRKLSPVARYLKEMRWN